MPLICNAPLATHLSKTLLELSPHLALGILGIWGWGLFYESFITPGRLRGGQAFIEGTVIVASLRLIGSLAGGVQASLAIALLGSALGAIQIFRRGLEWPSDLRRSEKNGAISGLVARLGLRDVTFI